MKPAENNLNSEKVSGLLSLAQNEDKDALSQLVIIISPMIHAQARRFKIDGLESDDLYQEGVIASLNAIKTYDKNLGASFSTYVNLIIRRRLSTLLKKHSKNDELVIPLNEDDNFISLLPDGSAEDKLLESDSYQELLDYINSKLTQRENLTLRLFLSGYTYQAIADRLNITVKSVDGTLQRVRKKLRGFNRQ